MIEMIRDPLTHIVRNAVDHGIEAPAARLKAGKREIGILAGLRAPVRQPDPDRHPRRRARHRRQAAGGESDRRGHHRQGCRRAALAAQKLALIFEAGPVDGEGSHRDLGPGRRHGRGPLQHRAHRRSRRSRQSAGRWHQHDLAGAADADHHPGAHRLHRLPAFRDPPLGDRGDRTRQRRVRDLERIGGAGVATIRGRRVAEVWLADILGIESDVAEKDRTLSCSGPRAATSTRSASIESTIMRSWWSSPPLRR